MKKPSVVVSGVPLHTRMEWSERPMGTFPVEWSDQACRIFADKYFRKAGVPSCVIRVNTGDLFARWIPSQGATFGAETHAGMVFWRLAGCWTHWGLRTGVVDSREAIDFYKKLVELLESQAAAPNSPQWFNTGLYWAYGIDAPVRGHYCITSTDSIAESTSAYQQPAVHGCFIQNVSDDLVHSGGILDLWTREARVFKFGGGSGVNVSSIRGKGELLSSGGRSSGLMSFLTVGDRSAGSIKSGGTTRRAAKMLVLDLDHPDVEDFILWKPREEFKVSALAVGSAALLEQAPGAWAALGITKPYTLAYEGEAYQTVSGQNGNNSVRITDEFMHALLDGDDWDLKARTNGAVVRTVPADMLWSKITYAAWASGDPGVQFDTTINQWNTCAADGRINASNPCSEYMFLDNTACNLASINLLKFYDAENNEFNYQRYIDAITILTTVLDISVSMAQYPSYDIAIRSYHYRTLGLGYANLGTLFMRCGIPYDSAEARTLCANLTSVLTAQAYLTSAQLAERVAAFPRWSHNEESMRNVLRMHADASPQVARDIWARVLASKSFRNAQVTLLAPTGTIGLIMDCDTLGIEPDFALVKHKELAGGGSLRIVNQSVRTVLLNQHCPDIEDTIAYMEKHGELPNHLGGTTRAILACANDISWQGHLAMMAAAQPHLSGAISKTVNLPHDATPEVISEVYRTAWDLGLKAVAVYRDGSKLSQPLMRKASPVAASPVAASPVAASPVAASPAGNPMRKTLPDRRRGMVQKYTLAGQKVYLHTGEYEDGTLGEIFISLAKTGSTLRSLTDAFAVAISLGLQYGVPLEKLVEQFKFTNFEPNGVVGNHDTIHMASSILDLVFRDLELTYLQEKSQDVPERPVEDTTGFYVGLLSGVQPETVRYTGEVCTICHSASMIRAGTCLVCTRCGTTTGCS